MLLSNPFRPDPRVHKEAVSLVKAGYAVTIVCWDRDGKHPRTEVVDGIDIIRFGPRSAFSRADKFLVTLPIFWSKAFLFAMKGDWDIVHCHDLDTLPVGIDITRLKAIPLVYDSHEIYSSMVEEATTGIFFRMTRWLEKKLARVPDTVICVNSRFESILKKWGVKNIVVVMGCPTIPNVPGEVVKNLRTKISPDGKPVVLYIGMLEPHRNHVELVKGFCADKSPTARLVMGGLGSLEPEITVQKGERFTFIGEVKPADLAAYNESGDLLIAVYDPAYGNNRDSVPNKLFEAMSASKPIVVAKGTWTGQTVEEVGCGLTATYGTDEVFEAIDRLLADRELYEECGRKGRQAYDSEYNWPNMEKRLLGIYTRMLSKN